MNAVINSDKSYEEILAFVQGKEENMVFAISPISYPDNFKARIMSRDVLAIELTDTAENIFDRLIFSDENDNLYEDDDYKELQRKHYLSDIQGDIDWYGTVYSQMGIKNKLEIQNETPDQVVERLIFEYGLEKI